MTGSRRRQRLLVLASLVAVLAALLTWPERPPRANAVQQCGPSDSYRNSLRTGNGVTVRPCLSKVNLKMSIPRTQTSSSGCGTFWLQPCYADGKWRITAVKKASGQTLRYADGTTESGLYRVTFQQFEIHRDATLSTTNGAGSTLTLKPDSAAKLGHAAGGSTIYTDLWVTGSSRIYLNFLTFNCTGGVAVNDLLWAFADLFTDISSTGCGMDLDIRYAVTTSSAANGEITGDYSVNLPNTTITVS